MAHDPEDDEAANENDDAVSPELAAHLDRGWELLKENDLAGARISALAAAQVDEAAPEAPTLLGAIAAAEGDEDAALAHYKRAMKLDPGYVSPMLYSAEIYLGPRENYDEALRLIELALDNAEEEDEYLDALLLKAEALIEMDDLDEARAVLVELPPVDFPDAGAHIRAGRCWLEVDSLDEAEEHYRKAVELDPTDGDGFYGLGLVYEQREDTRAMVKAWLRVRELDLDEASVPWALTEDAFEKAAEAALAELPERIRKLLEHIPIVAGDYPSIEIIAEGNDPRMMGFFSGVPYPDKPNVGGTPQLDCVFLYQKNIERMCGSREETATETRTTLRHETGHFFGLSEEELEEMGLG